MEKAGLIGLVKMRFIESDDSLSLRGAQLIEAIAMDKKQNLIPFFVSIYKIELLKINNNNNSLLFIVNFYELNYTLQKIQFY